MILVYRATDRAIFLYGFAKSERDNIDPNQLQTLRDIASDVLAASDQQLLRSIHEGALQEIHDGEPQL